MKARSVSPPARGIALPAMVFLLVIVSLMLAAGLALLGQSQQGFALQLQSARALAAAKSASDWALWQVTDPLATQALPADTLPPCFADQSLALPAPLADLQVQVSCTREPATGSVDEGGLKLASYRLTSLASIGLAGSSDWVQRQFETRHTVCKNPGGVAPGYGC